MKSWRFIWLHIISVRIEVPIKVRPASFCGAAGEGTAAAAAAGRPRLALGRASLKSSGELSRSSWSLPALVLSGFSVV